MYTTKSLKAEKTHIVFSYNKENFKKNKKMFLHAFLALITNLLKSRELGQYFKNSKEIYFVFF